MHRVQAVLPQGTVTGVCEGGVSRFSAIPYADAPMGEDRFRPPRPSTWTGMRDATRPGPIAPQLPSRLREAMGEVEVPQAEDCLHVTVWTPAADNARRPVVLWLHGGAWQSGGGALPWYDGSRLAALGDVVVVAANYRLAALGWLYVPGETANVGLLDQEAAIDWVLAHAEAFGGDPTRLTVMGQSAGAASICALLTRQPRFSRAILQSAALGRHFRAAAPAAGLGRAFLQALGVRTLDEARTLPVAALLQAQLAPDVVAALEAEGASRSLFCPVLDGEVLPTDIGPALAAATARADVLVAYTRDEMAAFPGLGLDAASQAMGDEIFGRPSRQWATDAAAHGREAWLARIDVSPSARFGACHCIELPFVFGTLDAFAEAPMLAGLAPDKARVLRDTVQQAWLAFIRGEAPDWPAAPHLQPLG